MLTFGEFVREQRIQNRLTLREFCRRMNFDPSNWSKIERGSLQPPKSEVVLNEIAKVLKIGRESEQWFTLRDLAAIAFLPTNLINDESIVKKLPVFFRTLRGQSPTREELEKLLNLIKEG